MAGLYLHIPFCKKKCSYCDFYSVAKTNSIDDFAKKIIKEISEKKSIFDNKKIKTVYFGGGTPSLLSPITLEKIINAIHKHYKTNELLEFTFEANPEDISEDYLKAIKSLGINRLSIGVQSFNDEILKLMKRRHNAQTSLYAIELAEKMGFDNISIDLIYGISGFNNTIWIKTLEQTFQLPIKHLSAYHLTIEPNTLLALNLSKNKYIIISENASYQQYSSLIEIAEKNQFYQYEISNFSKKSYESKHNSSYWSEVEYLGFGPSAHSYFTNQRAWNNDDLQKYFQQIESGQFFAEIEVINNMDKHTEYLLKKLRTNKGISLYEYKIFFGEQSKIELLKKIMTVNPEHYILTGDKLSLTPKGLFVSDDIISKLM